MSDEILDAAPDLSKKAVAIFDPVLATLKELDEHCTGLVFDVQTKDGYEACTELVKRIDKLRTTTNALREKHIKPHLEAQRALNKTFKEKIEPKCETLAGRFQKMLDVEDERRAAIQREKDEREAARIRAHRDRIVAVRNLTSLALGKSAAELRNLVAAIPPATVVDSMEEFTSEMQEAIADVLPKLNAAIIQADEREDAARVADDLKREIAELRAKRQEADAAPVAADRVESEAKVADPTAAARNRRLAGVGFQPRPGSQPIAHRTWDDFNKSSEAPTRPTDDEIIETLALKYRVHESKVIEWLLAMDLKSASDRMINHI